MGEPEQDGRPAREAAAYVAELTADLARIARQHRLDALCYLLEMARMEAQSVAGARARRSENEVS
jgi:hypothetical protein